MAGVTFAEAQANLELWLAAWRRGEVTAEQVSAAVGQLRVQDEHGRWWQPDPGGRGWLVFWEGAWQPAQPPHLAAAAAPVQPSPAAEPEPAAAAGRAPMAAGRFLEVARTVPWRQRPQPWWDLLAILGGAFSGYLFLVYSSIRGLPRPAFLGTGRESWLDFLPTMALLAVPVALVLLRRPLMAVTVPLLTAFGRVPMVVRVVLGVVVVGVVWGITRTPLFVRREGLDLVTPALMLALPIGLVWFRKEVDLVLAPLQVVRQHIPRFILIGVGLALPFLTAFVIYHLLGISQYPLLRANVVVGTLLSYVVLRTPRLAGAGRAAGLAQRAFLLAGLLLLAGAAGADDFYRDPFNLNDGLRTPGVAPVLAGIASVVVSIFVNGVEVASVTIQATTPTEDGSTPPRKYFAVQVDSVDQSGLTSTTLDGEKSPSIFVYAHCEEVGKGRFPAGDGTIRFALLSAQEWVSLEDMGMVHGRRCARVSFREPLPQGEPPATAALDVSAGAGGGLINATLTLTLNLGLQLAIEQVNGERKLPADPARPTFRVRWAPASKEWKLGELVIYFHQPGQDAPVRPSFTPLWDRPLADPDYLEFDQIASDDGGLTWRLHPKLKAGVKLTDQWLMESGEIEVRVSCTEQPGGGPA